MQGRDEKEQRPDVKVGNDCRSVALRRRAQLKTGIDWRSLKISAGPKTSVHLIRTLPKPYGQRIRL